MTIQVCRTFRNLTRIRFQPLHFVELPDFLNDLIEHESLWRHMESIRWSFLLARYHAMEVSLVSENGSQLRFSPNKEMPDDFH